MMIETYIAVLTFAFGFVCGCFWAGRPRDEDEA